MFRNTHRDGSSMKGRKFTWWVAMMPRPRADGDTNSIMMALLHILIDNPPTLSNVMTIEPDLKKLHDFDCVMKQRSDDIERRMEDLFVQLEKRIVKTSSPGSKKLMKYVQLVRHVRTLHLPQN
eukprot:PhF_6_TR6085/c1_g2_i1/m.8875